MLEAYDPSHQVRAFVDSFAPGTPDVEWIPALLTWEPKPVILCGDGRILRNTAECAALRECDTHFVFLGEGFTRASFHEQAWKILKVWPKIVDEVRRTRSATLWEFRMKAEKLERRCAISEV